MNKFYCVSKRTLLLIAGIVWLIAGFNVARLGVLAYQNIFGSITARMLPTLGLSLIIFLLFGTMFYKMSQKHTRRILSYEGKRPFWQFFDLKAYMIMAVMMGGGIGFRNAGIFPEYFIAFFYSGLGCALALAGMLFLINYVKYDS